MKLIGFSAFIVASALLSGCSTTPPGTPPAPQLASAGNVTATPADTMTGSRIPRKSTDRTVKAVGSQDYRSDNPVKSMGNEISRPTQ